MHLVIKDGCTVTILLSNFTIADPNDMEIPELSSFEAFSISDVRKWPNNKEILKDSYNDGIELLYSTYKIFYS